MQGLYCVMVAANEPPKEELIQFTIGNTIVYAPVISLDIDYSDKDAFIKCVSNMAAAAENLAKEN